MPVYEYIAINQNGKNVKGNIDADNVRSARQRLRTQGIFPTEIKESTAAAKVKSSADISTYFRSESVSTRELAVATRQLATLLGAGLPLVSSLNALTDQTESSVLRRIIVDVREAVEEGSALAKALGKYPKTFPRLYINMIASGEASGMLDTVLENLADYLEAQVELRRKVNSALMYPVLMLFVCTAVIIALFVFVIPNIIEIFQKQGAILPLPTRLMIAISDFIIGYWYLIIIGIIVGIVGSRWYYQQEEGRSRIDKLLLGLPIFGPLYTKVLTARISGTLGTLLGSGVGLLSGLEITRNIIGNVHVVNALNTAHDGVREGRSLASELSKTGLFPAMLHHMVSVGEQSGQLEGMLQKAGTAYEKDVNSALDGLTSLLEPLLMIVVGGIVLVIVISVLLPMADLINAIGG
jgi:general secretion pathway protein F